MDVFVTSGQSIATGRTLLHKRTVERAFLVYGHRTMDILDVFVTGGQSIARGGTLLPKGTLACIVLVYGRPFAS